MFEHIAVGVDFSPAMEPMLACLPGLREIGARKLTFVHVARLESPVEGWVTHLEYYEEKLNDTRPALEAAGFEVDIAVVAGKPAEEIVRIAMERGASLVLVGSRSASSVGGSFVGSVAWEVVRCAALPVLVQRLEPRTGDSRVPFAASCCGRHSQVLFPTDFSDAASHGFELVQALARAGMESFTLLHVRAPGQEPGEGRTTLREDNVRLVELAGRLRFHGAKRVAIGVPSGEPVDQVLRFADEHSNPLVVLGTHGRGWLAEMLVGSVSHDIVRRAPCSVLLVPVRETARLLSPNTTFMQTSKEVR